ncbi:hypothetical protein BpHYR1_003084 [Brachionus plicatilis]|uniref:Uncharacterized protein n=1 Tax=Brachionus plicatilis TaxID=10195 RepID=A0A3M7QMP9_BRAPC|nr:hypothetical protein BpHYR1_003084 [Brachionus plicatilis]
MLFELTVVPIEGGGGGLELVSLSASSSVCLGVCRNQFVDKLLLLLSQLIWLTAGTVCLLGQIVK